MQMIRGGIELAEFVFGQPSIAGLALTCELDVRGFLDPLSPLCQVQRGAEVEEPCANGSVRGSILAPLADQVLDNVGMQRARLICA